MGRVDGQLAQLRERYATARTAEDYQAVGLVCRDIIISLGDACYDHERHGGKGKEPSSGMNKLEKAIEAEAAGGPNKQLRQLLKASMELANNVQHDRTGTLDKAAIAAEATVAAATLMRITVNGAAQIEEQEVGPASSADADIPSRTLPPLGTPAFRSIRFRGCTRTLDSHASRRRRKLNTAEETAYVLNDWGVGYWPLAAAG